MEAWVLSLTVPQEEEQGAERATLPDSLHRGLRDGSAENDSHREVGFCELSHGEHAEADHSEAFINESFVVRISVLLPSSGGVGDDGKVVTVHTLTVHRLIFGGETLVCRSFSIEMSGLLIVSLQLCVANRPKIHGFLLIIIISYKNIILK